MAFNRHIALMLADAHPGQDETRRQACILTI